MNVSLICACKNRIKPLLISLQSWLFYDEIKEIIIVDWSSDNPIDFISNLDSRIKVIRVNNQKFFNQPQPLNLALKFCSQEYVIKVDADYILNPYPYSKLTFFTAYHVDNFSFVCGDYTEIINDQVQPYFNYLRGLLYIKRDLLLNVGGWNENMGEYYGGEDGEIENRLELLGLQKKRINLDYTIIHIPHSNKERICNFKGYENDILSSEEKYNLNNNYVGNELEWSTDHLLAYYHIKYNVENFYESIKNYYIEPKTSWCITELTTQNYIAEIVEE